MLPDYLAICGNIKINIYSEISGQYAGLHPIYLLS